MPDREDGLRGKSAGLFPPPDSSALRLKLTAEAQGREDRGRQDKPRDDTISANREICASRFIKEIHAERA
jgi:hypothetical protein